MRPSSYRCIFARASSCLLVGRRRPNIVNPLIRQRNWYSRGGSSSADAAATLGDLSRTKAFLFSPTITAEDFATKWNIIDRLNSQGRPPWLGKALTYVAATWRDYAKQRSHYTKNNWMLPIRPETAYFVLDVLLHEASLQDATIVVEDFVKHHPNVNVFAQRLQVWSQSGLPNAREKIEEILQEILDRDIQYTRRMYAVLLRHFVDEPNRVEQLRKQINESGMVPDTAMWAALASSYARNHRIEDAIHIWKYRILESTLSDTLADDSKRKQLALVQASAADLSDGLLQRLVGDDQATRAVLQKAQSLIKALHVNRIPMNGESLSLWNHRLTRFFPRKIIYFTR